MNKAMNNSATLVPLATAASGRCPGRILCDSGLQPPALCDSGLRPLTQRDSGLRPLALAVGCCVRWLSASQWRPARFRKQPSSLALSQAITVAFAVASIRGCFTRIRTQTDQPVFASSSACFRHHSRSLSLSQAFAVALASSPACFHKQPTRFRLHRRPRPLPQAVLGTFASQLSFLQAVPVALASSPGSFRSHKHTRAFTSIRGTTRLLGVGCERRFHRWAGRALASAASTSCSRLACLLSVLCVNA